MIQEKQIKTTPKINKKNNKILLKVMITKINIQKILSKKGMVVIRNKKK